MKEFAVFLESIFFTSVFFILGITIISSLEAKIMIHWINNLIAAYFKKRHTFREIRILKPEMYDLFKSKGEGFYYASVVNTSTTNFIAKAIRFFTKSNVVHSMIMLYSENLKSLFTTLQWQRLEQKWKYYYGDTADINISDVKVLVLGSADDDGMNYFNYANYQDRQQSIRKVPNELIPKPKEVALLDYLCSAEIMSEGYDYIGLTFFFISRFIQDEHAQYCSELVYESFDKIGIKTAGTQKPSPAEIENYNLDWIIYKNY